MARTSKPGVYKITNLINDKFYIGSSIINVHQRWNDHKSQLRKGTHPNVHLLRSYNKHGLDNFNFEVLEYCTNVLEREQYYIDVLKPHYNIELVAGNSAGTKRSVSTCNKIGLSKVGNVNRLGKSFTNVERLQISNTLKEGYESGRIVHPMLGKNHSKQSLELLSKSKMGNTIRKEHPTYTEFYKLDKVTLQVVSTYNTARECADSVNQFGKSRASNIIHACRRQQVAFGFRWSSPNVQVKSDELLEKP